MSPFSVCQKHNYHDLQPHGEKRVDGRDRRVPSNLAEPGEKRADGLLALDPVLCFRRTPVGRAKQNALPVWRPGT